MNDADWLAARFEESRPHLRLVAYRMLGSLPEADDAVQNSWLRLSSANASEVENLAGWLTTVVARECLNMLRARRHRREEPIGDAADTMAAGAAGPEEEALLADAVGPALMVVLDTLAPAERLAFVLHDVFALPFDEIAAIVERSPAATRQLASRARRRVRGVPPVRSADFARQRQVAGVFLAALRQGDLDALIAVLDPGIVLRDARAAPGAEPVRRGSRAVASYALRYSRQARFVRPALVDGTPGLAIVLLGRVIGALAFTFHGEAITEIEMIDVPDRLRRVIVIARGPAPRCLNRAGPRRAPPASPRGDDPHRPERGEPVRVAVTWAVLAVVAGRRDLPQHVHAADHGAERGEGRCQGGVLPGEEELAAVRVRPGVGHGDRPGRVLGPGQVLVVELVAGTARAGARGVTALQHEDPRNGEPVAVRLVVVALAGQETERERRAGRLRGQHPHRDDALGREEPDVKGLRGPRRVEYRDARSAGIAAWYPHAPAAAGAAAEAAAARTCRPGACRPGSAGALPVLAPDAVTLTAATAAVAVTRAAVVSSQRETRLLRIMCNPFHP
jgi:RNA polymerase sigma factor (sigma-70 family)